MRFKEGQKVRVRKDLVVGHFYGGFFFNESMDNFKGKMFTIVKVFDDSYNLDEQPRYRYFTDEMLEPVDFTKLDLETGMVVEYRDGRRRMVFGDRLLGQSTYYSLNDFEETLFEKSTRHDMDIMKIYRPRVEKLYDIEDIFEFAKLELIWERQEEESEPEAEEMTLAEIEMELGRKIKIVSEES